MERCEICGLPIALCTCKTRELELQVIKIRVEKRKWGKDVTIVEGVPDDDIYDIAKYLKSKCACGGTVKENMIILQGRHTRRVRELLEKRGFPSERIEVEE